MATRTVRRYLGENLWAFDEQREPERDDDDDDGAELEAALDAAEAALRDVRAGRLSDDRAGIALARADIALARRGRRTAEDVAMRDIGDSAVGESTAGSVLDLERRGTTSRSGGTELDANYPPGRTTERSTVELERSRPVDHRRDFDAEAQAAEDAAPELRGLLLPAPRARITPTADAMALDSGRLRNQQLSREINARIDARQQRPRFDELVGLA